MALSIRRQSKSMVWNRVCFLLLIVLGPSLYAQQNRYMVFFKDKAGTPHDLSIPHTFLGERAIARRTQHQIAITEQDKPVTPMYVQELVAIGADVLYTTRWMNGALIQAESSIVNGIGELPFVERVEWVAPGGKPVSNGRRKGSVKRLAEGNGTLVNSTQLDMLGIEDMHLAGYRGEGVIIAVFDAGFPGVDVTAPFAHVFTEGRFNDSVSYNFVYDSRDVFQLDDHGTEVLSTIAAHAPGVYTGGAYKANFQLYVTE